MEAINPDINPDEIQAGAEGLVNHLRAHLADTEEDIPPDRLAAAAEQLASCLRDRGCRGPGWHNLLGQHMRRVHHLTSTLLRKN